MKCFVTQEPINRYEAVKGKEIQQEIFKLIEQDYPAITEEDYVSIKILNKYRRQFFANLISQEKGEMEKLDQDVVEAIRDNSILSENIKENTSKPLTTGDRIADKVASFGGSWTFIISFFIFLLAWMFLNFWMLHNKGFDPYPFILLNLILSCLAAIQAPIIMMSQNRQEDKDRDRAEHDYKINLKAELEIKLLSEKIDHLLVHQNKKLLEIQEMQIQYLENIENQILHTKDKKENKKEE
ncbi:MULTISPECIES: DUF1003 domain-containing protein [Empedobacter]|uniref:Predicted membrane protein n=1 Tax=Empedobacter falsenii TaxID=343874 RepID=A0A376G3A5_9FLAO|nr:MULTISPECIES: DUF1003 domain-containing protein [Empedobacter]MBW1617379.1 DUF1003 domain-containing protein [Empedobacter falsenii]MDH0673274.1 DUF1003 domain-containing protein [Empedobacter sp. GD03861]MDM1137925.1 DUF1003 domain-containing protein [Empedobacter sp. R132-2]STD53982.1 Predicted membrane protein [Empedobacter falsenii]